MKSRHVSKIIYVFQKTCSCLVKKNKKKHQGHVQAHTGAQRFAMVSALNDMFPGNRVQQGLRYISLFGWVCQKCQPNQQQRVYKPAVLKTARTMGPSEII